jgi:alcohol dehydrogenase class IV
MHKYIGLDDSTGINFLSPQEVLAGDGKAAELGQLVGRWATDTGAVLVVRDAEVARLGVAEEALTSVREAGFSIETFDEVTGEPDFELAERVVRKARTVRLCAVVGIGGGSSMDLAKLAAAAVTNDGEISDFIGADKLTRRPIPTVLIPTTAGTGAEATRVSMLSLDGEKQIINSPYLVPVAAILDPHLIVSLPPGITAATGMDALSHAIESFLSRNGTPLTRQMGGDAMRVLAAVLPRAFDNGSDLEARRGTLYAAYLSGLGLNAGVVMGHSMAYTIANRVHLPHGVTAAMALPYCLAYNLPAARERIDAVSGQVAEVGPIMGPDVFDFLVRLNEHLGVPQSLKEAGIPEEECEVMAEECLDRYPRPTNPVPMESEPLKALYRDFWSGDLQGCLQRMSTATDE